MWRENNNLDRIEGFMAISKAIALIYPINSSNKLLEIPEEWLQDYDELLGYTIISF